MKIAISALGWDAVAAQDAELYASFDEEGAQELVWLVGLTQLGGGSTSVFVDAMTGHATIDSRTW